MDDKPEFLHNTENGGIFKVPDDYEYTTNEIMNDKIRQGANKNKKYELYHGSPYDFNEFDDTKIGSNSMGGLTYGKGHYFTKEKTGIYGKYNYKVDVNLKKPFVVEEYDWSKELGKLGYKWNQGIDPSDFLSSKGYDATIIKNGTDTSEIIIYSNKDNKIKIVSKE